MHFNKDSMCILLTLDKHPFSGICTLVKESIGTMIHQQKNKTVINSVLEMVHIFYRKVAKYIPYVTLFSFMLTSLSNPRIRTGDNGKKNPPSIRS